MTSSVLLIDSKAFPRGHVHSSHTGESVSARKGHSLVVVVVGGGNHANDSGIQLQYSTLHR